MAEVKTKETNASVVDFINALSDTQKRDESFKLLKIFKEETGLEPKMWGSSIIGFGKYHYKSERSSQEADWPLIGFSPRKQNLTIYIITGFEDYQNIISDIGKCKTSRGCLYINKLSDINELLLRKLIHEEFLKMKKIHMID